MANASKTAIVTMALLLGGCHQLMAQGDADSVSLRPSFGLDYTSELQTDFSRAKWNNILQLRADVPLSRKFSFHVASSSFVTTNEEYLADDLQGFSNIDSWNIPFTFMVAGFTWHINDRHSLFASIRRIDEDYFWGVQASIYNGMASDELTGRYNMFRVCPKSDGVLVFSQVEYRHQESRYGIGASLFESETWEEEWKPYPSLWAYVEQKLSPGLTLLAAYSHAFDSDEICKNFCGLGATYTYKKLDVGLFSDYTRIIGIDEWATELTCNIHLTDFLSLQPAFHLIKTEENSKKVRYALNDCFLIFWFRFFYKYQALVENKALKALGDIIKRDYSGVSGLMMERYFMKKFQEEGRYIVGKWWDRKGDNEIDLIVVDIIEKEAWIYELKKQGYRYKEDAFREKVDKVLEQTPELRKMTIHVGSLSLEDM